MIKRLDYNLITEEAEEEVVIEVARGAIETILADIIIPSLKKKKKKKKNLRKFGLYPAKKRYPINPRLEYKI
ncbi:hypothetical protein N7530_010024 [Penicillium desertorum]|uniref:Uncharacterized protein n=1 Tax=Penicillium desertorum TaxID=1303715 RepID=A0A9W9WK73_9EURO|nr:hypothetical protein N7530_010024 [Penicillium desertorum]